MAVVDVCKWWVVWVVLCLCCGLRSVCWMLPFVLWCVMCGACCVLCSFYSVLCCCVLCTVCCVLMMCVCLCLSRVRVRVRVLWVCAVLVLFHSCVWGFVAVGFGCIVCTCASRLSTVCCCYVLLLSILNPPRPLATTSSLSILECVLS